MFTRQLQEIRAFAEQINAVDTSSVAEAIGGPSSEADTLREDTVRPGLDRDEALALAPKADRTHGLFKVPRVLNG
jgi:aspartyl/glutamyl-tRNA(Asn/Gln) amidotransferase C subunit